MSTGDLVSIVLPTYNGSRFLARALESIQRQTHRNWELLVQDDCSTDSTPEIIARFAASDPRIKPQRNAVNLRLPRSLNAGFARATGAFLTWTSDDNEFRPEALEAMVDTLRRSPQAGLVYADMTFISDDDQVLERWTAPAPGNIGSDNVVAGCFLYRREVRDVVGDYDDRWRLVEDWDYWLRVANRFPLIALNRDLYLYRRHAGSLTATRAAEIQRIRMELLAVRLPDLAGITSRQRALAYLTLSRRASELGEPARADEFARRAVALDPLRSSAVVAARRVLGPRLLGSVRRWWMQFTHRSPA